MRGQSIFATVFLSATHTIMSSAASLRGKIMPTTPGKPLNDAHCGESIFSGKRNHISEFTSGHMKYTKSPLTVDDQIALPTKRAMIFDDENIDSECDTVLNRRGHEFRQSDASIADDNVGNL